jgi:hypothetical protein
MVLAAGGGSRLAPLTIELPKPLCPVGGRALLDHALQRLAQPGLEGISDVVVNVHHHAAAIVDHLASLDRPLAAPGSSPSTSSVASGPTSGPTTGPTSWSGRRSDPVPTGAWPWPRSLGDATGPKHPTQSGFGIGPDHDPGTEPTSDRGRVWVSHERDQALGTAGAIGNIRPWLDGRGVLVINADAWTAAPLSLVLDGWDGQTARVLVVGTEFGPNAKVAGALVPWRDVVGLPDSPAGLYEHCWAGHAASGTLEVVTCDARFVDCGSPADYLHANLLACAGSSSVDPTATVGGTITRCVVWPGAVVEPGEVLTDAVRTTGGRTVLIRSTSPASAGPQ